MSDRAAVPHSLATLPSFMPFSIPIFIYNGAMLRPGLLFKFIFFFAGTFLHESAHYLAAGRLSMQDVRNCFAGFFSVSGIMLLAGVLALIYFF